MKKITAIIFSILALNILIPSAFCQEQKAPNTEKTDITYIDGFVLGLVEGFTEYLPVSSTGHLILANNFLNLDTDTPLKKSDGSMALTKDGKPYTMKAAADAYAIVIQLGAIAAVAFLYRKNILSMIMGLLGRDKLGLKLLINLIVAFLPAAIIGLVLHDIIENLLFGLKPVIIALAVGALLMFVVQKVYDKKSAKQTKSVAMEEMSIKQALVVGLLQCVAMWPGTSRSMMTILGGYLAGLKPADSAKFSFLLGLATLSAASFFKMAKDGQNMLQTLSFAPLLLGLIVAFIAASISVKWFINFLTKRGLTPFAWYRLALAATLCALMYYGILHG